MIKQYDNSAISIDLQQQHPIPLWVQLDCQAGELLALVGSSGSGKTTILRAISGLYQPENSQIICCNEMWQKTQSQLFVPAHQRNVGLVFQNYALFPHMTVFDNIKQAMLDRPKLQRHEQALILLEEVYLDGLGTRHPKTLSGGQQQRVAVARALARNPKFYCLMSLSQPLIK